MVVQGNVLRIFAPAISNKVLPVPSALSNKLHRLVSLEKAITQ